MWRFIYTELANAFFAKTHNCTFFGDYLRLKTIINTDISFPFSWKINTRLSNYCFVKQWTNFFKSSWQHAAGLLFPCIHRWCRWGRKSEMLAKVTEEKQSPNEKSHADFKQRLKHRMDMGYQCWPMSEILFRTFLKHFWKDFYLENDKEHSLHGGTFHIMACMEQEVKGRQATGISYLTYNMGICI